MALAAGTTIGRYTLEKIIGRGGAGEVYSANDAQLDRKVALKLLRSSAMIPGAGGGDPENDPKLKILREARAAAALDHPNCVAIFDVGSVDLQGLTVPWLAMELVDGTSLRAFVDDYDKYSIEEKLSWLGDLARALNTAHTRGMIHRDVKPENVMIRRDGVLKVLDFGVAKRMRPRVSPSSVVGLGHGAGLTPPPGNVASAGVPQASASSDAFALGTVAYMAPEQVRGERLDGRTDQFAWGVLAYELLTGQLPWPEPTDPVQYVLEMMASEPPRIRSLVPEVPEHLEQAVHRALAKEPKARFATMGDLLAALGLGMMRPRERSMPPSDSSGVLGMPFASSRAFEVVSSGTGSASGSSPSSNGHLYNDSLHRLLVPGSTSGRVMAPARPNGLRIAAIAATVLIVVAMIAATMLRAHR